MTEPRLSPLFAGLEDPPVNCRDDCPAPEELQALASGKGPVDEALLARIAACGACSESLRYLLEEGFLLEQEPSTATGSGPLSLAGYRRRKWFLGAAAAVAAVLLISAVVVLMNRAGPGSTDSTGGLEVHRDAVVFFIQGRAWIRKQLLSPGDLLCPGDRIRLGPDTRVALLDRPEGRLYLWPGEAPDNNPGLLRNPVLSRMAGALGPDRGPRRARVMDLPVHRHRTDRPDFLALKPRGGIRSDRPAFEFSIATIGPEEDLILRVLDEQGEVGLEHRFQGAGTVAFPGDKAPLKRGKHYVWNVFHPRSGSGPLGGEAFRVIGQKTLEEVVKSVAALGALKGRFPSWALALLEAVLYRHHGLQQEALEALPDQVPGKVLNDFLLEERALILNELGHYDRIGPLKEKLSPPLR